MTSLRYVNSCPLTKSDWDKKAKQKNCSSSSANICLDSPTKLLVYHCVPNEDGVGYAEICSQVFYSLSFCVEFSSKEMRLVTNFSRSCSQMSPPCPQYYISTDIYKYKECFDPTKNGIDTSTIRNTHLVKPILVLTTSYPVDKNEKHNDVFIGVIVGVAVLCFPSLLFLGYFLKYRCHDIQRMTNTDRESSEVETQDGQRPDFTAVEMCSFPDVPQNSQRNLPVTQKYICIEPDNCGST